MKQSLQIRLGQSLTMTPQLQQAIRLLQLSTLDLQAEIQQVLDSNLMLEAAEDAEDYGDDLGSLESESGEPTDGNGADPVEFSHASEPAESFETAETAEASETPTDAGGDLEHLPDELAVDSSWDDIYDGSTSYSAGDPDDERDPYDNQSDDGGSLRDHLLWQANLANFTERDYAIAVTLIDAVRDDGYLGASLEDIQAALPAEWAVEPDEICAVLTRVQRFDPVGVASRSPGEALLIQLQQLPAGTPWLEPAKALVAHHLELLVNRQYGPLTRKLKISQDDLQCVLALIRTLDPRPGSRIGEQRTEYVVPDVFVRKVGDRWQAELNREAFPKIRINGYYASLVRRADNSADNTTLRNHLQEARWFLKSLQSRNDTLLKVARSIVNYQQAFFDHGELAMKPLVLREVAEEVEMHESTISRITTSKYLHTPRGTFEFKYFFSSHVQTADGDECSATAIRARIKLLIAQESPAKPLSDSQLADILKEEGINVARRTVAKYREAMAIASSTERKRLA